MKTIYLTLWLMIAGALLPAYAQTASGGKSEATPSSEKDIEQLYDKFENDETARQKKTNVERRQQQQKRPDLSTLSELSGLAPFEDVAVIERRFLPKTGRFELSGSGLTSLNNPFFNNLGGTLRIAYYFRERYGVELMYYALSSAEREATQNLREKRGVLTSSLVSPRGFMGGAFKWSPIYGKVSFLNQTIVPFDLNFSFGAGTTSTDAKKNEFTFHFGTSQVFAISKSWAFRWDLAWNFYQAHSQQADGTPKAGSQIDLFLGLGVSFFFPEATYR